MAYHGIGSQKGGYPNGQTTHSRPGRHFPRRPPPAPDPVDLRILETLLEEKLLLLELLEAVQALTTAILARLTRT